MYYSQFEIAPVQGRNPYELHKLLWKAFPERPDANRDFLFRVDWPRHRAPLIVLLQSQTEPAALNQPAIRLLRSKPVQAVLQEGMVLRFALCANPSKRVKDDSHRRVALYKEEEQLAWLERKMAPAGQLLESQIMAFRTLYFSKSAQQENTSHRGKIVTVTFGGILQVTDAKCLNQLLETGVGSAKSFGCGLLTLARA
ncbi:MAG: type I-E CRISPR-associated protein Cas6/Cse3/CasE [Candidatus Sericytochromatia bacterium]